MRATLLLMSVLMKHRRRFITEGSSTRGGIFTSLLYDMFEGARWHAPHSERAAAGTMALAGLTDFPDYMGPESPRGVVGVSAEEVVTSAMDAHPTRAVYLTGACVCVCAQMGLYIDV